MRFIKYIVRMILKTVNKFIKIFKTLYLILTTNSNVQQKVETFMVLLVLLILSLSLADTFLIDDLRFSAFVEIFDFIVCGIFAIDLYFRFKRWEGKSLGFFKSSWIEIIAIIPLDIVFRFFRLARLFRLIRLSRISRLGRFGNTVIKLIRMAEMSLFKGGSYFRFKRFKNLLFGYGTSKTVNCNESDGKDPNSEKEKRK